MLQTGSQAPSQPQTRPVPRQEAAPKRQPLPAGTTRLQAFTAVPEPVAAPAPEEPMKPEVALASQLTGAANWQSALRGNIPSSDTTETATEEPPAPEQTRYRSRVADQMSMADYRALSDEQRAAVDFNTMLVQARQKDLKSDYQPNEAQREVYQQAVERMFGKDGGSDTFAPETISLLNKINFQPLDNSRFDDLDNFLGLKATISQKEIDRLGTPEANTEVAKIAAGTSSDIGAVRDLAGRTMTLEATMQQGNQVLDNFRKAAATTLNEDIRNFGGTENPMVSPDVHLNKKIDSDYFDMAYQTLANSTQDAGKVWSLIQQDLGSKKQLDDFLRFADTKSQYAATYKTGLGGDPAVQYRTPEEFRQILGLDKGEADGSAS